MLTFCVFEHVKNSYVVIFKCPKNLPYLHNHSPVLYEVLWTALSVTDVSDMYCRRE